jgi:probable O-glycosylation ligase (exosortase A-associated)
VRDIVLILATLGFLPLCFRYPAIGAICWVWFSIMNPHRQVYGIALGQQFNLVIAAVTLLGWLISSERKRWTPDLMPKVLLLFVLWTTFNSFFAIFPDYSWVYWDRTVRTLALVFLVFFVATTKARIHGLVWILVLSIGYYSVKGGLFTIATGGNFIVLGPPDSILGDNNQMALGAVMVLPLINYLRIHTEKRILRLGLGAAIFLQIIMVLGSHSRGAAVALAVAFGTFCLTTRRKIGYIVIGGTVLIAALSLMPASYFSRLDTISGSISEKSSDTSFQGRVEAWHVATGVAVDQFPFGAGFNAPQLPAIFHRYEPEAPIHAAHSIYFQILGEQGFIGLAIYLLILFLALWNTRVIIRQTRDRPELLWAYDLVSMMRIALVSFYVGGAALSMAYFDGFLLVIALLSALRELTARKELPNRIPMPISAPARVGGLQSAPGGVSISRS